MIKKKKRGDKYRRKRGEETLPSFYMQMKVPLLFRRGKGGRKGQGKKREDCRHYHPQNLQTIKGKEKEKEKFWPDFAMETAEKEEKRRKRSTPH